MRRNDIDHLHDPIYDDIYQEIAAGTARDSIPGWAHRVLDEIAGGRRPVAAIRHPLGFLCLPLERRDGRGVCLHLWSPDLPPAATTSPVHCHSWDLISFVLYGTVHNVRARLVDQTGAPVRPDRPGAPDRPGGPGAPDRSGRSGVADPSRVFEVVSRGEVDELRATARIVRCAPGEDTAHRTGDTYTLPAGVFHSTFIDGGHDAATVALGRPAGAGGDLSLGPLDLPTHHVRRRPADPDETARAALDSCRRIAAAHAT